MLSKAFAVLGVISFGGFMILTGSALTLVGLGADRETGVRLANEMADAVDDYRSAKQA